MVVKSTLSPLDVSSQGNSPKTSYMCTSGRTRQICNFFNDNLFSPANSPKTYYMCTPGRTSRIYKSLNDDRFSFIQPMTIQDKKLTFTFLDEFLVDDNGTLIRSLSNLLKRINIPDNLNQDRDNDLLNKIAIIANFLHTGNEYNYVPKSATLEGKTLSFLAENKEYQHSITLPSFREVDEIHCVIIKKEKG